MNKLFFLLALSLVILIIINIVWAIINLYMWANNGIQLIIQGTNLLENIYYSKLIGGIICADVIWIIFALIFMFRRKNYKSDLALHYLQNNVIENPILCVIIPTYNESSNIENVVKDYINQKNVKYILVIDNKSTDNTAEIAKAAGARVIIKDKNRGFSHSYLLGLNEALKTDANVIITTEADGTYEAKNIERLFLYLENCDLVTGSRQNQILTQKDNQNTRLHVWGNFFLAKLIQLKYFNLHYWGIINLTDVGCGFLIVKREALKKIIHKLNKINTEKPIWNVGIRLYLLLLGIENDLRILEVPITFRKRIDRSRLGTDNIIKAIKIGLAFLWIILRY